MQPVGAFLDHALGLCPKLTKVARKHGWGDFRFRHGVISVVVEVKVTDRESLGHLKLRKVTSYEKDSPFSSES